MTKIKRLGIILLLISVICCLCASLMGNARTVANAAEDNADTVEQELPSENEDIPVEDSIMSTVKEWIAVGFSGVDFALILIILIQNAIKAKQAVSVMVNDEKTQKQLDELKVQTQRLSQLCMDAITLEHGTFEFLKELFAHNPNIPEKSQAVIASLTENSNSILKDVQELFSVETREAIKDALEKIGNITLG